MLISNQSLLEDFCQKHAKAVKSVNRWVTEVIGATWESHSDLKKTFPNADYVGNGRYVFNISGNNFRMVALVIFLGGVLEVRFVGTHAEYDKIKKCSEL